jgi:two-component system, cell cycle sensor histidine kinase and response regulator CckA
MARSSQLTRYRRIFDESPEPMWLYDEETLRFVEVNRAAVAAYGYSRDEFLAMDILAIRPEDDGPRLLDHIKDGGGLRGEWVHRTKAGTHIHVEVAATRMTIDGRPLRLVIARDVSLKAALEEQLRHAQKIETVGRLAGGIAHDFNNLLTAIVGHVEVLSDFLAPGDPRTAEVTAIREAAEIAADLTHQLLAFSRTQRLAPGILNVNDAVNRTRRVLQRMLHDHIALEVREADGLWSVRADQGEIEQIILNLALNARDAMPDGGVLTLETANVTIDPGLARRRSVDPGNYVELSVRDTGLGIAPDVLVRLFEPFFSTKDQQLGKGLGLATVYGIVKQSGGHIIVESEVGQGTRFAAYLPTASATALPAAPRTSRHRGSATVLVVEKDRGVRSLISAVLGRHGYELLMAEDEPDALRLSDQHASAIHLMVTSITAAHSNGVALASALHERRPDTRVLFLQKPFTPDSLARKVRSALEEIEGAGQAGKAGKAG